MKKQNYKNIFFNITFSLLSLFSVCFLWEKIILLTVVLAIISVIGLFKWKNKETVILFFFSGALGTISEIIAIYFGVWHYVLPSFCGVPIWLFILWGNAAVSLYQTGIEIKNITEKQK